MIKIFRCIAVLFCVVIAACSPEEAASNVAQGTTRHAAPLDSAARAERTAWDKELAAWADTAPASVDSVRNLMAFQVHAQLARLGYAAGPIDADLSPALSDAIRHYEGARGLELTGDPLSFTLMRSLEADISDLAEQPSLPSRFVHATGNWVSVEGAWVFEDMGAQSIAVSIECDRARRECIEVQAILQPIIDRPVLSADLQRWEISNWDHAEITTVPVDYLCTRYTLRINLVQETATKVRSTISNVDQCRYLNQGDVIITLTSGIELAGSRAADLGNSYREILLLGPSATRLLADSSR